jgi:hypothetical protein
MVALLVLMRNVLSESFQEEEDVEEEKDSRDDFIPLLLARSNSACVAAPLELVVELRLRNVVLLQ